MAAAANIYHPLLGWLTPAQYLALFAAPQPQVLTTAKLVAVPPPTPARAPGRAPAPVPARVLAVPPPRACVPQQVQQGVRVVGVMGGVGGQMEGVNNGYVVRPGNGGGDVLGGRDSVG
ncbi:hypothetical protein EX30DRAFT_373007 [Ascodesmis nigricans]|uniref:Uncharacterized protein n=1 Tax=Ascodesmis nigricans TaxID=341454 RepID=A0A4V3SIB5_9PEZI|nr:hypothetical protein EX30DRAFT_373007 [Ascodesmis nigricans]